MQLDSTETERGASAESIEQLAERLKTAADIEDAEVTKTATPEKKRKPKKQEADQPTVTGDELAPVFMAAGQIANARWPSFMPIEQEEAEKLGRAWAPVVEKYAPQAAEHSVELMALLVSAQIFIPRVMAVRLSSNGQLDAFENGEN